jgi:predicted nucleic acid-binding protein
LKVILDTNVLISGVYFGGYPYRILEAWNNNRLTLIVSREILDEYPRTMAYSPYKIPIEGANSL